MRHIVNFGLLFAFATLAVSGGLAFFRSFSITTTRVHVVFGITTLILVGLHLFSRLKYFRSQLQRTSNQRISRLTLASIVVAWGGLLFIAIGNFAPIPWAMGYGYEAKHRLEIVRNSAMASYQQTMNADSPVLMVAREPSPEANVRVAVTVQFGPQLAKVPTVAIWAESTAGAMIETLYLDPKLTWAEEPEWGKVTTNRSRILPIWRHRYTVVSGIDPSGKVDALTSATPTHSFSLDSYLTIDAGKSFVLCLEVNLPHDPNVDFEDPHLGQPSLLYTALIEPGDSNRYVLLELTGHGGGAEKSGAIQYDLDGVTSARDLVELILARSALVDPNR